MYINLQKILLIKQEEICSLQECCGPVKGPEERHELGITWNKYVERKYKYSIGIKVLNVNLTAKVLGWN